MEIFNEVMWNITEDLIPDAEIEVLQVILKIRSTFSIDYFKFRLWKKKYITSANVLGS